jgi:hypothetical protein
LLGGGELGPEPASGPQDDQEQYGKRGFFHGYPLPVSYSDGLECRTAGLACQPDVFPAQGFKVVKTIVIIGYIN